jgi:hypothetical protein
MHVTTRNMSGNKWFFVIIRNEECRKRAEIVDANKDIEETNRALKVFEISQNLWTTPHYEENQNWKTSTNRLTKWEGMQWWRWVPSESKVPTLYI